VNTERLTVNGGGVARPVYRLLFTVHAFLLPLASPLTAQIQDNSFFLEEAYNQEFGVVQHISTFTRASGGDWTYAFTQEWPLGGIRHQLSYTLPIEHFDGTGTGLGDVGLNYRYQLAGHPEARTVVAPRITLLLPTGKEELGRGNGGVGVQANLPVTLTVGRKLATHWNLGATVTPSARNFLGAEATTTDFNAGASFVWLLRPSLNLLVETIWLSEQSVAGSGRTVREESVFLNPGVRAAFNLAGGLQIVPGVAYTVDLSADAEDDALFFYLSFEHPFKRQ
jgi:hypothetical protein